MLIFRYDGLWIDMNEPSNFVTGDMEAGCADTSTNYPPYYPGIRHQVIKLHYISSRIFDINMAYINPGTSLCLRTD